MLVSADFLVSNFIRTKEIPVFLRRRKQEGMLLAPLLIKPCAWQEVPWLEEIKGGSEDNVALSGLSEHDQDQALANLAREIKAILHPNTNQSSSKTIPSTTNPTTTQTPTILSDRLPTVKGEFFGRKKEESVHITIESP